jgi:hypothetical protein
MSMSEQIGHYTPDVMRCSVAALNASEVVPPITVYGSKG